MLVSLISILKVSIANIGAKTTDGYYMAGKTYRKLFGAM